MSSNRIGRINDEIQKELSALLRTVKDPRVTDCMLTITHVDTTSDLRYARIYVSALNCPDEKGLLKGLKSAAGYLRHELGSRIDLRYTPELQFFVDDSIAYGAHILDMLNHVKPADPRNADIVLPENARSYQDRIAMAIDHHPSQEFFARETCLEADSAACGEIVYDILRQLTPLTPEMALPLYVAISTDTGCFVYSNTTPRSHRIAAQLMDCGIDVAPVNKALFRTKSAVRLAMEARMVAGMERCDAGRVVVMQIPLSLRQEMHATDADIEELSALAAQVEGTDCGVTLRELRPGTVKLSLRTGPRVNATEVCRLLGGGGHAAAAGATVSGTMAQAKSAVLAAIAQVIGPLAP